MKHDSYDPDLSEQAKKMAAGPLGEEMAKFPMKFASPAFFGQRPSDSYESDIVNGTVSLVDFGNGPMAITCFHVLDGYKKKFHEDKNIIFQISNLKIDPILKIIDENETLDLATIDLDSENLDEVRSGNEIGSYFFQPSSCPPEDVKEGDFVAFGGFPGKWRWQLSRKEVVFDTFSSGATVVTSVTENHIVCQFERDYWVDAFNLRQDEELHDLGGLSGAPVFVLKKFHYEFIGIVYEFSSEFDLMYVRPSRFIEPDGTIST